MSKIFVCEVLEKTQIEIYIVPLLQPAIDGVRPEVCALLLGNSPSTIELKYLFFYGDLTATFLL